MISKALGIAGSVIPFIVVPIRESLGLKTNQYTKKMLKK